MPSREIDQTTGEHVALEEEGGLRAIDRATCLSSAPPRFNPLGSAMWLKSHWSPVGGSRKEKGRQRRT